MKFIILLLSFIILWREYKEDVDHEANYEFHTFKEDGAPSGQRGASGH